MNLSEEPETFDEADPIEARAADWLGRRDGGLTAAEEREFQRWLAGDRRHAAAYARLEATSSALDQLVEYRTSRPREFDPDLSFSPTTVLGDRAERKTMKWVALAAAGVVLAISAGTVWQQSLSKPSSLVITTAVGGLRAEALADGSRLDLNTDSSAEVAYSTRERRVTLRRGEAHFQVEKDSSRPFVVQAGGVVVRAVGTAFNVRLTDEGVDVLVTEGRVQLEDARRGESLLPEEPGELPVMTYGQRAVISTAAKVSSGDVPRTVVETLKDDEIARRLAWQDRRIEFGPTPLRLIVAEFNRHNQHQLRVANDVTGLISVGGSFRASDYETFVRLLESSFQVVAERGEGETVLRQRE